MVTQKNKLHPNTLANLIPQQQPRHEHQLVQLQREILTLGKPGEILATSENWESFLGVLRKHKQHNKISYVDMAMDCDTEIHNLYTWLNHGRSPRLRTVCPVFENLGYELILRRKL